ncbi:MAG: flavin reductase [Clostridia bacterium]|nr:flavin reductase [Clostridia bacterium]
MDNKAMYKIGYGLYVLSARVNGADNACIINTAIQVTSAPNRISVTVNKQNKTHDMIVDSGKFNISMLSESADFAVFERFGFQSGANADKLADYSNVARSENGIIYLPQSTTAFLSATVFSAVDLGTHTMFIANVTDGALTSDANSLTYDYYQKNIKPKPAKPVSSGKPVYRCRICGYVHEGELPPDFVCPVCKHGVSDFEKIS